VKKIIFILFCFLNSFFAKAGDGDCNCPGSHKSDKGTFYFAWGYNRDWFSKSDIHFYDAGKNYDFTLYDAKAKDRAGFDLIVRQAAKFDFTIPQYNYRMGYYFPKKNNIGIEINFDHTKYVMVDYQTLHLKGQIGDKHYDLDTLITPDGFLQFEHTNGANFLMVNFLYRKNLLKSKNQKQWLSIVVKPGAGIVIPKTDVTLFGEQLDNKFHIAGWLTGVETGIRYDYKHFFAEFTGKGTFANYSDVLILPGTKANHHFWCAEAILTAGFQFGL